MHKRQDAWRAPFRLFFLLVTGLAIFMSGACQSSLTSPDLQTSPSATKDNRTPTQKPSPSFTQNFTDVPATITPTPDCRQSNSELHMESFLSDKLGRDTYYIIYLPPCYTENSQQGLPVLYLLHGLSYNNDQWLQLGLRDHMDRLIAAGKLPPFIIVMPEEAPITAPQLSLFPEVLTEEIIPWIDSHYATRPHRLYRGIGGISRGAAWAVQIGFENPELFSCVGAHSLPLFQADGGKVDRWLSQNPPTELPRVFIDIGRNDQEWTTAQNFASQLDAARVPHEWYLFRNGHTEEYWASHLELYLTWYAKYW